MLPVQGIIGLSEVKEDLIEDLPPHCLHLMEQLGFEGYGPLPPKCPETVQHILKINRRPYLTIHHHRHCLTNYLNKHYTTEYPVTLIEKNYFLPCTLHENSPPLEICLDNTHHFVPLVSVRPLFMRRRHQPRLKVLHSHSHPPHPTCDYT